MTISLANISGGAPGTYITESTGVSGAPQIASFTTVYMLVDAPEEVSISTFPENSPVAVYSLNDYLNLIGGAVPISGSELLSYNAVKAFFRQAFTGDLRVVRVGTPANLVELGFDAVGKSFDGVNLPADLVKNDVVYVQLQINGYDVGEKTSAGAYKGIPVTIPSSYLAGDESNNREIAAAIRDAVVAAIRADSIVSSSVYVRGTANSTVDFSALAYLSPRIIGQPVSVIGSSTPQSGTKVLTQSGVDISNVAPGTEITEGILDYIQAIETSFSEGSLPQGYLIAPAGFSKFNKADRAKLGQAMEAWAANENSKWMAFVDAGPYWVTQIQNYTAFTEHRAGLGFDSQEEALINNRIYKWTGDDYKFTEAQFTSFDSSLSINGALTAGSRVALSDSASFQVILADNTTEIVTLSENRSFVDGDKIDLVLATGASAPTGLATGSYYVITTGVANQIKLAATQAKALAGTAVNFTTDGVVASGILFNATVKESDWGFNVTINGETSDLIQANADSSYFNTQNLPGTLQSQTDEYLFKGAARKITQPNNNVAIVSGDAISSVTLTAGTGTGFSGADGTYYANTIAGSTAGASASVEIVVLAGAITTVSVFSAGSGYLSTEALALDALNLTDKAGATAAYTWTTNPTIALGVEGSAVFQVSAHGLASGEQVYFSQDIVATSTGAVTSVSLTNGGAYTTAPTSTLVVAGVPLTGGTGAGAQATIAMSTAGIITSVIITTAGTGYVAGDVLGVTLANITAADGTVTTEVTPPQIQVISIEAQEVIALGTTATAVKPYYVTKVSDNLFKVSSTLSNYTQNIFSLYPTQAILTATPTIVYKRLEAASGGGNFGTPDNLYFIRGRKYNFDLTLAVIPVLDETGAATGDQLDFRVSKAVNGSALYDFFEGANASPKSAANDFAADTNYFCVPLGTDFDGVGEVVTAFGVVNERTAGGVLPRLEQDTLYYMPIWTDAALAETVLYNGGSQMVLTPEVTVPSALWNYDAVTSQELIDEGLRGTNNGGVPEAILVESGVSNHALLIEDSQQYYTPQGFLAYYGPHIEDSEGYIIPASSFVAGLAIRRSRAQGFQFPPAGVSYPLNGTAGPQISISSAEQDVSNRLGMNALRTLPGYGNTVFVWGGRTRVNAADADQGLYKFVNTRVILNVIYGTLKGAFDSQIFSVVDGRGLLFTKIRTIAENVLYVFWAGGALFGANPSDAYATVCDRRNNPSQTLEEGLVYLSVFVVPVPTLERIQIDLVRVAIDDVANTLEARGFGG